MATYLDHTRAVDAIASTFALAFTPCRARDLAIGKAKARPLDDYRGPVRRSLDAVRVQPSEKGSPVGWVECTRATCLAP